MTREEILDKAIYFQYCLKDKTYKKFNVSDEKINKFPIVDENMFYTNWKLNEHHFTTDYHIKYSFPLLSKQLGLEYNRNDFILDNRKSNEFDISILKPKKEYKYEIYGYTRNEHFYDLTFDDITSNNSTKNDITGYHRLYKYSHECSRLINKTLNNNRKLFISGDSQVIPDIPFLSCFFKEVWLMDNRNKLSLKDKYKDVIFTDTIVVFSIGSDKDYFVINFM